MACQLPERVQISYGGGHFDLSNLCIDSFDTNSSRYCRLNDSIRSIEPSLYPEMGEIHSILIDLESPDVIFQRAPTLATRTRAEQRNSASSPDHAFYSKSSQSAFYTPEAIKSDFLPAPVLVDSPTTAANICVSILESQECSMLDLGTENLKERARKEIEVCPGVFMLLRGAEETLQAIESGFAIEAMCFCCEQGLQCIADADLVICPDCRICSPLPVLEDYEDYGCSEVCEDDFERSSFLFQQKVDRRRMLRRQPKIGGVGLGLKTQVY
jgi:hypothetical protein